MSGYNNLLSDIIFTLLVSGVVMETEHCVDLSAGVVHGRRYTGHTYRTAPQYGFQQCLALCRRRDECQSINYDRSRLHCELNLDLSPDVTALTLHSDYLYVEKATAMSFTKQGVACLLTPCRAHSVCVELHDGNTTCIDEPRQVPTTNSTSTETTRPTTTATTGPITTETTGPITTETTGPITTETTGPITIETTGPITTGTTGPITIETTGPITTETTGPITTETTGPITTETTGPITTETTGPITTETTGPITTETTGPITTETTGPTKKTNSAVAASCTPPYTYYGDADFCVWAVLGSYKEDWLNANSDCMSNGGDLAKADTGPKINVVASLVGPITGGWVGARYNPDSEDIVWVASMAIVEPPPMEDDGICVSVNNDGHMELRDCFVKREYVCEKNA